MPPSVFRLLACLRFWLLLDCWTLRAPGSAFALFCSRRRAEVKTALETRNPNQKAKPNPLHHRPKSQYPDLSPTHRILRSDVCLLQPQLGDIQKELSTQWKELEPEEKQVSSSPELQTVIDGIFSPHSLWGWSLQQWTREFESIKGQLLHQKLQKQQQDEAATTFSRCVCYTSHSA